MTTETDARRKRWNYEDNVPRCLNCRNFRKARIADGRADPPFCVGGRFEVKPHGCCDRWKSKTGETLL